MKDVLPLKTSIAPENQLLGTPAETGKAMEAWTDKAGSKE